MSVVKGGKKAELAFEWMRKKGLTQAEASKRLGYADNSSISKGLAGLNDRALERLIRLLIEEYKVPERVFLELEDPSQHRAMMEIFYIQRQNEEIKATERLFQNELLKQLTEIKDGLKDIKSLIDKLPDNSDI